MTKQEHVAMLRTDPTVHYNCCQSVLIPFCEECGLTPEQAFALGAQFGSGMKMGSVCGALTGALMVLGMARAGDDAARQLVQTFRTTHEAVNCADLLKLDRSRGNTDKKAHCDGLVADAVDLLEQALA